MAEPKNTLKKVARRVPGARAVRDTLRPRKVGVGAAPATSSPPPPPPPMVETAVQDRDGLVRQP